MVHSSGGSRNNSASRHEFIELHAVPSAMAPEEEALLEHAPLEEEEEGGGGEEETVDEQRKHTRRLVLLFRLGLSFFLFGLINNVLYVIILSAALDLVPPSTPKGIIAFCNIAPSLVAKVGWPYLLKGRIRYIRRIVGCWFLSTLGMIVVAGFDTLEMRLLGIGLASFSSGLGELTFLQRSTTYRPPSVGGRSVGYFASGTGAAGLVGALVWWEMRSLGVRTGVGISAIFPLIIPLTYFFILPRTKEFSHLSIPESESAAALASTSEYAPISETDDLESMEEDSAFKDTRVSPGKSAAVALSAQDKWELVKPLLLKYMLPLSCVYLFEYTINQGVAPTLVYPVPSPQDHPLMSLLIHSIRDYYPLWQLVYQATVFLSRSSISLGLPPLPARLLSMPAIVQCGILIILALESGVGLIPADSEGLAAGIVFILISIEGVCGGLAYVNVFYRINQSHRHVPTSSSSSDPSDPSNSLVAERLKQEHEFQIGSIGFADSSGILLASLVAMPTEVGLCKAQIARGKMLCGQL